MHKETNKKEGNDNAMGNNQINNYVSNSVFNGEEEDKTNKEQMLFKFVEYFNSNVHSPISNLFFGFIKTKRICQTCKTGYYSFSNYCFIVFDISNSNNNFNLIKDGFENQYNNPKVLEPTQPDRVYCERCLSYQKHLEFNRYLLMNHLLIISFIRGNNYQNNSNIIFDEFLNLEPYIDEKQISPKNYALVGSINRVIKNGVEEFIYFAKDPDNNIWHLENDEKLFLKNAPIDIISKNGQILMLFYNNRNIEQNNNNQ